MNGKATFREWLLRALLLMGSAVVALLLFEVLLRVFMPISDGRANVLLDGTPISSWFEPNSVYRQVSNEYDAITTISAAGHRVPGNGGNPEVVFLGDSFTYGWGLSDDETFAMIYCREMKIRCANLGVPGTGQFKQLARLEAFLDDYDWHPREVKLFIFAMTTSFASGNDLVDNYHFARGELVSQGEAVVSDQDAISLNERIMNLQSFVLGNSHLMRYVKYYWGPLLKSLLLADPGEQRLKEALGYTAEALAAFDLLSRERGFDYQIYLIVPVQDVMRGTYGQTLAALSQISPRPVHQTGDLFVDDPERFYYSFDGHLNAAGSRAVAGRILELERESGVGGR